MTNATLAMFRELHACMQTEPTDWQWNGQHMSQNLYGITQQRAEEYAARYGGTARKMDGYTPFPSR